MAKKTISQRIALDGGKAIESQLKDLGAAGERAFDQIRKAAIRADLAKFGTSLKTFGGDLASVGTRLGIAFAGVFAGLNLSAAGAAAAVFELAKSGGEAADQAGKAAASAGLQVDAYSRLQFAAKMANVEQTEFDSGMARLNKTMGDAARGSKIAVNAFQQLGVRIKDANGKLRDPGAVLLDLAQAFARLPDGARKSSLAMDIFGRSGAKLLPFLNEGRQGLIDLGKEAEDLGVVFTRQQAEIGDALGDALDAISTGARGIKLQIGLIFAPAITKAANALLVRIKALRPAIQGFAQDLANRALPVALDFIAAITGDDANVKNPWVLEWRDGVIQFGQSMQQAFTIAVSVLDEFRAALDKAAGGVNALFGTNISGDALGLLLVLGQLTGAFRLLWSTIVLAKDAAILLFSLARANPWIAAITAVAGGIALWATRTDSATAALSAHEKLVNDVRDAYSRAGEEVAKMSKEVKDRLLVETVASAKQTSEALQDAIGSLQQSLRSTLVFTAKDSPFRPILEDAVNGKVTVKQFIDEVARIGTLSPDFAEAAKGFIDLAGNAEKLGDKAKFSSDFIDLLTGKINDAEFKARQAGEGFGTLGKNVSSAASDVTKIGDAADQTAAKVEDAGKRITVTKFGQGDLQRQTFEMVDGVARAVDTTKAKLGELGQTATQQAGAVDQQFGAVRSLVKSVGDAASDAGADAGDVSDQVTQSFDQIAPAAQQAATEVQTALGSIDGGQAAIAAAAILTPFQDLPGLLAAVLAAAQGTVQGGFGALAAQVTALGASIRAQISQIIAALRQAVETARAMRAAADSGTLGGNNAPGLAGGGSVRGPGTSTSDSILAWLSDGEYVVRAAAVQKFGKGFFDMLNSGVLPSLKALRGYNFGGIVEGLRGSLDIAIPRYAGGGLAERVALAPASAGPAGMLQPLHLHLPNGDDIMGLFKPIDVASKLGRHATASASNSTGRKPGWYK